MAASYYLATNSVDVFHFGLLEDGQSIATGQPALNFYPSEEQLASALSTLTGNPNYYYENYPFPVPPDPFLPEASPSANVSTSDLRGATGNSQVWVLSGNLNDSNGKTVYIQQGPFLTTGYCTVYGKYNGSVTAVQLFTQTNSVFPPVPSFDGFVGTYSIASTQTEYLYFAGITSVLPDPTVQGYEIKGDLTGYNGTSFPCWVVDPDPLYSDTLVFINIVYPYDPGTNITVIQFLDYLGDAIPYHSTGDEISLTLALSDAYSLPPVIPDSEFYVGTGRTYFNLADPTTQYYDLFDYAPYMSATDQITISSISSGEITNRVYVESEWGEIGPFTRVRFFTPTPYGSSGEPINWKYAR